MNRSLLFQKAAVKAAVGAVLVATVWASELSAQDWTNWRGPTQNGVSPELELVDSFKYGEGENENVLWESNIGGRATPIVMNGRVYLNCRTDHNVNDPKVKIGAGEQVVCWDAETGELLWKDVFNVFQTDIAAPRVGWAAMCGDKETGNVFMHSVSGLFRCYKPDGTVVWEHSLHETFGKLSGYGGRTQTPIIDGDRVIVSFLSANWGDRKGPGPVHTYYAFDKRTGHVEWISAPGGRPKDTNYSVPVIAEIEGQRLLIGGNGDGHVYAMQASTGKKVWEFKMSERGLNASPVVDGKYVYISHGEDNIDNTEFGRVQCIDGSGTGDITDSGSVWRIDGVKAGYTGLLINDGIVYITSDTGIIFAYDSKTGDELWQQAIGTVGKGSPVFADGKIYVMEVNGNIRILKPSREGCEELCHVELPSVDGVGVDEIYASPAIANGKIYFVTRDRLICVGKKGTTAMVAAQPAANGPDGADGTIATVLMTPAEVTLRPGESVEYTLKAYDAKGRFIKSMPAENVVAADTLPGVKVEGNKLVAPKVPSSIAGNLTCKVGDVETIARVRIFSDADEWAWDFDDYKPMQVPPTWIRAFAKFKPQKVPGTENIALRSGGMDEVRGRPSHIAWIGPETMSNYTVQSDVYLTEQKRRLSSVGVNANRYNLIIKGNNSKLELQSWAAHLRLGTSQKFVAEPNVWYTMKITTEELEGGAVKVLGKVWKRDEEEPKDWTIEVTDPRGNANGSPGIYVYQQAESFFDNIKVTPNK